MKRIATTFAVVAVALGAFTASASARPSCHWTHFKRGGVTYYVQHCTVPRHITKHHATKWNKAGPGGYNTVTPSIG
jgi:uncharacterized membrane protein YgdD (TMEM256/DUF423 family)